MKGNQKTATTARLDPEKITLDNEVQEGAAPSGGERTDSVHAPAQYRFNGFRLDATARTLSGPDGAPINLSSRAFDTLVALVRHRGRLLSKDYLLKTVWPDVIVEENNLNQAISSLRKLLGDSKSEPRFIQTISGRGYRFIAAVEAACMPAMASVSTDTTPEQTRQRAFPPPKRSWPAVLSRKNAYTGAALVVLVTAVALIAWSFRDAPSETRQRLAGGDGPPAAASAREAYAEVIPSSVAVMPFTNLNPPTDDGLFAIALHDEIINRLSKVESLKVISRENVLSLGEQMTALREVGRLLRTESVITGTIMYLDEKARISLQMLDPVTGVTLWASSYDAGTRDFEDMIALEGDIALNVAHALRAEIKQQEKNALRALPTDSFEAYRYFLAAKNAYYFQDFEKTWTLAQKAIELDPRYIDAHDLFSYVNTVMTAVPLAGMSPRDHFLRAMESAEKIIQLTPDDAKGYVLRANALATTGDWERVRREVDGLADRGVPLAELRFYALVLLCLGDFEEAIRILEANLLTQPINLYGRGFLMAAYELTGEREQARREYRLGEELNPLWWGDTVNLFLDLGRRESLKGLDDIPIPDELKALLRRLDDRERVMSSLEAYRQRTPKMSAESVYYSAIAAYTGEHDLAVELMREGLAADWLSLYWLWLPVFDETRQTRAFRDLLADSGIVEYWRRYGWPEVCRPADGESFVCDWRAYPAAARLKRQ